MKNVIIQRGIYLFILLLAAGFLAGCACRVSEQAEVYFPMRSDDGIGLMDCAGEWVVAPLERQYVPGLMMDGLAPVLDYANEEFPAGILDASGEYLLENAFINAWPYSEGYAAVETPEGFRFIDRNGDYIFQQAFPVTYQILPVFGNGMVNVVEDYSDLNGNSIINSMVYMDANGEQALGPYQSAYPFSDGYAAVTLRENGNVLFGFINTNGDFVLEFSREDTMRPAGLHSAGLFPVRNAAVQSDQCQIGWMNLDGEWVIDPQFCAVGRFSEGLAAASIEYGINGYIFGYINPEGEWVIEPQYEMQTAYEFSNGCTLVSWNGYRNFALMDTGGNIIFSNSQ